MNESRRSVLEYIIGSIFGFIGSVLAVILGTVTFRPAFLKQRQDWLEVGPVQALTRSPKRFDVSYVQRQGWAVEERKEIVYAFTDAAGKIQVLSSVCTHLTCTVRWNSQQNQFQCPCHGGVYDAQGKVIAGPPPQDLRRFPVRVEQNKVLIRRA